MKVVQRLPRNYVVASLFICLCWCYRVQGQTAPPEKIQAQSSSEANPTLSVTMGWLNQHLVGIQQEYITKLTKLNRKGESDEKHAIERHVSETVSAVRANGCQLDISIQSRSEDVTGSPYTMVNTYRVPLELVKPPTVVQRANPENSKSDKFLSIATPSSFFQLYVNADREVISKTSVRTNSNGMPSTTDSEMQGYLFIQSDDGDILTRVANAMTHAIQLCHRSQNPDVF